MFSQGRLSNRLFLKAINKSDADIVHLHWVQGGGLAFEDIMRINKPVFISMHDMWLFTGGCHYDSECGGYLKECGNCPILSSRSRRDLSYHNLAAKRKVVSLYGGLSNLHVIGLSRWLATAANASTLLQGGQIYNLPNPIDTVLFSPRSSTLRERLGIPVENRVVLFGAMQLNDLRKGGGVLKQALAEVMGPGVSFLIFGSGGEQFEIGCDAHFIGHVSNDMELAEVYSAADVLVVPSLQENLSNAVMEAMSCGTPVVAFEIGGNKDMIDHMHNGYLARLLDVSDLAAGIKWVIFNPAPLEIRSRARHKVLKTFDQAVVASRYRELYEKVVGK